MRGPTARQTQVAALLADGLHYSEAAACLSISERQVQRHVAEAVARLDINNVYELVAIVVAQGIVPSYRTSAAATDRGEAKNAVEPRPEHAVTPPCQLSVSCQRDAWLSDNRHGHAWP